MKKLSERILKGDWEVNKKDPDIETFYHIREQLYMASGLIFRLEKIIIPQSLHRKVVKAGHSMGHLGITKYKQMLRDKYWFPRMNTLIEEIIGQCYECRVTTKEHKKEPAKMTTIPEKPWDIISVDFGGPYPDGHYNLVAVDKRTRYPEVETTHSTAFKPTKINLKKMFATHGTPSQVETDNGPPFNSKEFEEFAEEEGFHHHKVTPDHAQANGEAESFMKMLNKTEQIARLQGKDTKFAIQEMLTGYRSTPHPATNTSPYEALMNRKIRTKLDYHQITSPDNVDKQEVINDRDRQYKEKLKEQAENRNTKPHSFIVGYYVLLKQQKKNKWSTAYEPAFYIIYRIAGSSIGARRITDGREIFRDASHFKLVRNQEELEEQYELQLNHQKVKDDDHYQSKRPDWRENILSKRNVSEQDNTSSNHQENQQAQPTPVQHAELNQPEEQPTVSRPQRTRRRPAYLEDYLT